MGKGKDYIRLAEQNNLRVVNGKGSHTKIYVPVDVDLPEGFRNPMVVPHGELAPGTERCIYKWFKALGFIVVVALALYVFSAVGF